MQSTVMEVRSILNQANMHSAVSAPVPGRVPMFAKRQADRFIGRDRELQSVCEAIQAGGSVIMVGGPGEGKSMLANEAGLRLWEWGTCPAGVFRVDLRGAQTVAAHPITADGDFRMLVLAVSRCCRPYITELYF